MKIKITYLPEEEPKAAAALADLRRLYPRLKVHKSDTNPPFKCIYLTIARPGNPTGATDRT